ncbi:unannotated protein [freshwater metagenome]|uniref:Unannotated protein n=1 Tax=freshwater metagenome TaxID=449393 RepID=A0A6J7Q3X2_9ZZZZ
MVPRLLAHAKLALSGSTTYDDTCAAVSPSCSRVPAGVVPAVMKAASRSRRPRRLAGVPTPHSAYLRSTRGHSRRL